MSKADRRQLIDRLTWWAFSQGFDPLREYPIPPPVADMFAVPRYPTAHSTVLSQTAAEDNNATAVAPQDNKPYAWADGVDITGGLVECCNPDGDIHATGIVSDYRVGDDSLCIYNGGGWALWMCRPAPQDFAVGDRVRVVSTAATNNRGCGVTGSMKALLGTTATITFTGITGEPWVALDHDILYWHPDDLLYIPPATLDTPAPTSSVSDDVAPYPLRAEYERLRADLDRAKELLRKARAAMIESRDLLDSLAEPPDA